MRFTDMDMLQDYEKDTRMAAMVYSLILTDVMDPALRKLLAKASEDSITSQEKAANLILSRGDRP